MARVFASEATGATIVVFSNDHCPPHVHALHRGDGWTARVEFSFLTSFVRVVSVSPRANEPSRRILTHLLSDIEDNLPTSRRLWWAIQGTTCLVNQWATLSRPERIDIVPHAIAGARKIAAAAYDPQSECVSVAFADGTTQSVSAGQ